MSIRVSRIVRRCLACALAVLAVFISLAVYTNVPNDLTEADRQVFKELGFSKPVERKSFEQEIDLIRKVQQVVFLRAPLGEGIPDFQTREPADLMNSARKGLCYDRSRTFDKALEFLGFETRHVYLLFREDSSFLIALLHHGQASHAVTEVKTSKGWMFVDSNTEWIALARNGEPVNADDVWHRFAEFDEAPLYLRHAWWAIRGMYSRKGQLYPPYIMFPDINWPDFLSWLVRE